MSEFDHDEKNWILYLKMTLEGLVSEIKCAKEKIEALTLEFKTSETASTIYRTQLNEDIEELNSKLTDAAKSHDECSKAVRERLGMMESKSSFVTFLSTPMVQKIIFLIIVSAILVLFKMESLSNLTTEDIEFLKTLATKSITP